MTIINTSQRSNMPEYIFAKLASEVARLEQSTQRKVLNFGPGTPDIRPSKLHLDKLQEFIQNSDSHRYPGYGGIPAFNQALINWYKQRFQVNLENQEVLPLLGGKDGVTHITLALTDPGDEILVPNPGYPAYIDPAILLGAKSVTYDLLEENNFNISLSNLASKITKKTKFIWINFPSNPTGRVVTLSQLENLVDFASLHKLAIVYDNAYSEVTFDSYTAPSILQIKGAKDVCVEIGSFSKSFSFAGFRMGWIVGNSSVIHALGKVKSQLDSGLSLPLQNLGAFALNNPDQDWQKEMLKSYSSRRDIIATKLTKLGLSFEFPQGSLYIWAKIPDHFNNASDYCHEMLHTKHVLFTPGSAFGSNGDRHVRVSICINIDNIEEYL